MYTGGARCGASLANPGCRPIAIPLAVLAAQAASYKLIAKNWKLSLQKITLPPRTISIRGQTLKPAPDPIGPRRTVLRVLALQSHGPNEQHRRMRTRKNLPPGACLRVSERHVLIRGRAIPPRKPPRHLPCCAHDPGRRPGLRMKNSSASSSSAPPTLWSLRFAFWKYCEINNIEQFDSAQHWPASAFES